MTVGEAYARLMFSRCLWYAAVGILSAAALSLMSGAIHALSAGVPSALIEAAHVAAPLWLLLFALPLAILAAISEIWRDFFGGVGIRMNWSLLQREAVEMSSRDWFALSKVRGLLRRVRQPASAE